MLFFLRGFLCHAIRLCVELFDNSVFRSFEGVLRSLELTIFGPTAPLSYSFRASSALDIFESGLRSLELTLFGPTAPLSYSFRASSALDMFESGLRSLELTLFGPTAPLSYSFRVSSAFDIFELGLRSLELILFGPEVPSSYLKQGFDLSSHFFRPDNTFGESRFIYSSGLQCSSINMPESWWQITSSDAVCQIRR
jgi:hypothetical protein